MSADARWRAPALYVPGDAADKLAKALDRGADAADRRPRGRRPAGAQGRRPRGGRGPGCGDLPAAAGVGVWVRVNPGALREADVRGVAGAPALTGVVLAKTETARRAGRAGPAARRRSATPPPSCRCWRRAAAVLRRRARSPRRRGCSGCRSARPTCAPTSASPPAPTSASCCASARTVVLASAAAGIAPPIAPVSTDFRDLDALPRVDRGAGAGSASSAGPASTRPRSPVVNEVFTPTPGRGRGGPRGRSGRSPVAGSRSTPRAAWSTRPCCRPHGGRSRSPERALRA